MYRPIWAEISLSNISHNIREFRKIIPNSTKIMAMVKANGYGHGASQVSKKAIDTGVDYLAVASLEEAIELRKSNIKAPILILGYTPPSAAKHVVHWDLTQSIFNLEHAESLSKYGQILGKKAKVHVKVDTGIGRLGLQAEEASDFIDTVSKMEGIYLEGVFSHFATADEANKSYAERQTNRWKSLLAELEKRKVSIPLLHIANSAATIEFPNMTYDMVRIGISMYGLYPSKDVNYTKVNLRQAMQLKTKVIHIQTLEKGSGVSYGATMIKRDKAVIATIPIGYGDGYSRRLSGMAYVLIHGQKAPVFGRICMDFCMIDVTDIKDVNIGDEVVVYGDQGNHFISLDEVANVLETISNEVACNLGHRVPRIYK
ncbi:alanine racemase [Viridibacillus sp. FSL R5-0477]|uniref:Alanine racemase n=2 Tax=Viridibacillus TaxID=496496 RepID=W4F175_9BACL|nr:MULTISPECIES: alanine racemase [Viridibacillus]ETT86598.1 alanine racemase [Viridibacillus arenosi FSL R5-213]OMC83581.1 alanine racemase [Viridibacillus sp. FSL H8-0123]OMC85946.1 alanine racemase [Viridibacillus sp. FSL H7-0596]OMC88062.1 alanine racemase [Viridibacillus arenosi]